MNRRKIRYRTVDLASIIRDIFKQWWCVLLFSIAVALLVNAVSSLLYRPMYTTSTTFVVTTRGTNASIYQDIVNATDTAARFSTVLQSNILKRAVVRDLQVDEYNAITEISQLEETNLIILEVKHRSALMSYKYLKSILNNYSKVSDYVIKSVVLNTIEKPTIPINPSNSNNASLYSQIGFFVSFVLAVIYIACFSYLKDTVKNAQEASSKLAAKYLGSVYHETRGTERRRTSANVLIITNPILSLKYTESCRMLASRVQSRMDRKKSKVLLVTSVAENEGKSTVASNIALSLAQEGRKVLIIDADFRKPSLYKIFDIEKTQINNLVDILRNDESVRKISIIKLKNQSLYFVLNNTITGSIDDILANRRFESLVEFARVNFDYTIIDTAPMGLIPDAEGIAEVCDSSLIVVKQDTILAQNINDAIDSLNETKAKVLGVVLNDARTTTIPIVSTSSAYNYGY